MSSLNRRDFLKLAGAASLSAFAPQFLYQPAVDAAIEGQKNILILVFDAWSARHISLYGYPRETMPNLSRLAEKAIVYHNHFSAGNFTTPGTASLLTGVMPWTHRATAHNDTVLPEFQQKNMFSVFSSHNRLACSHNILVNTLLKQFLENIDSYTERNDLMLTKGSLFYSIFQNDEDIASVSRLRALASEDEFTYSLFFSRIIDYFQGKKDEYLKVYRRDFPLGLPYTVRDDYFVLEQAVDLLYDQVRTIPGPFLGYYHFLPPHAPYLTRKEFVERFSEDGYLPPQKPIHQLSLGYSYKKLLDFRASYDEYLPYVDAEFNRLYQALEASGVLENTWLILTSDHGEMFERGTAGHTTSMLYEPVIRIPLLIFEPGRKSQVNIFESTSSVDVLPTLMRVTNQKVPEWTEGAVLPPFNSQDESKINGVYAIETRKTKKRDSIREASVMLVKDDYKLTYYFGYDTFTNNDDLVELYHIRTDPEELRNLVDVEKGIAAEMLAEVKKKLGEVNQPYLK